MKKRLLTVLMILMLLFTMMPMQAFAEKPEAEAGLKYLNIGDSIAAGLSALPNDYFAQYAGYLGEEILYRAYNGPDMLPYLPNPMMWADGAVNLGFPGLDSMELLEQLEATSPNALQLFVAQADVITISIGGNNLLTPVIASVFQMYGLIPGVDDEADLMEAIMYYGDTVWNANLVSFIESALSSDYPSLGWWLETRTAQFLEDWPVIQDKIEALNPDAHIIAMTLYNPIEKEDNELLFNRYEALVSPMNMAIRNSEDRIMIADVEKAFDNKPDAVDFRLTWMDEMPTVLIDPHPTTLGHNLIFKSIKKLGNPESFK
jgi:hypothetical protein